jgi:hypothetical protein
LKKAFGVAREFLNVDRETFEMNEHVLEEAKEVLLKGLRLSKQGSYARRAPACGSLPFLIEARHRLRSLATEDPSNGETWELLSHAEECLMDFREAIACLERAMALKKSQTKKDKKRLAILRQALREWDDLLLTPEQVQRLGEYLRTLGIGSEQPGRSLLGTRAWLNQEGIENRDAVIEAIQKRGAFSDFQVLENIVRG